MNWKVLFGLLVATVIYIVGGTLMFMYVEGEYRLAQRKEGQTVKNMSRHLQDLYPGLSPGQYELIIQDVLTKYNTGELHIEGDANNYEWDFPTTFFFVITTLMTIGYGNIAPATHNGRALTIVYCLFGIPLMFYTLSGIGDVINAFNRRFKYSLDPSPKLTCLVFFVRFSLTFTIGWMCFIQLPALIFTTLEGWPYADSIYFAFVTLTTIGFGDFTPSPKKEYGSLTRVTITIWLFLGLAWLSTTIKAMQDILNYLIFDGQQDSASCTKKHSVSKRQSTVRRHRLSVKQHSGRNSRSVSVDRGIARSAISVDSSVVPRDSPRSVGSSIDRPIRNTIKRSTPSPTNKPQRRDSDSTFLKNLPSHCDSTNSILSEFLYKVYPGRLDSEESLGDRHVPYNDNRYCKSACDVSHTPDNKPVFHISCPEMHDSVSKPGAFNQVS